MQTISIGHINIRPPDKAPGEDRLRKKKQKKIKKNSKTTRRGTSK